MNRFSDALIKTGVLVRGSAVADGHRSLKSLKLANLSQQFAPSQIKMEFKNQTVASFESFSTESAKRWLYGALLQGCGSDAV
jgi:hypothetical protein